MIILEFKIIFWKLRIQKSLVALANEISSFLFYRFWLKWQACEWSHLCYVFYFYLAFMSMPTLLPMMHLKMSQAGWNNGWNVFSMMPLKMLDISFWHDWSIAGQPPQVCNIKLSGILLEWVLRHWQNFKSYKKIFLQNSN